MNKQPQSASTPSQRPWTQRAAVAGLTALTLLGSANAHCASSFDASTNRLSMASVRVGDASYLDVSATINAYTLLGVDNGTPGADTFNPSNNLLTMGSVVVQGVTYPNVRVQLDSFALLSAAPIRQKRLSLGRNHSCFLKSDRSLACWGYNVAGQLGDNTVVNKPVTTTVPGLSNVAAMAAGDRHTCALKTDGTVVCWGSNSQGQLGDSTVLNKPLPTAVPGLGNVTALAAGGNHTCAVKTNGSVACWGSNGAGQLGDSTQVGKSVPTIVAGLLSGAVAVEAGVDHTCAVKTDGTVACWGRNNEGQLGDNTVVAKLISTTVPGVSNVATLSAVGNHNCALKTDGAVVCWGRNDFGQIGDGTLVNKYVPTPVGF